MRRLRKKYKQLDYISVIEPQASGRWHFHVLLKSNQTLYISNEEIAQYWGKGFTKTKRLSKNDKIGNYVVAYLSNLDPRQEIDVGKEERRIDKKHEKGLRLHFYPKGIRIYRASRGIERPIEITCQKKEVFKNLGIQKRPPDFVKTTTYKVDDYQAVYKTEFYNDTKEKD